LICRLPKVSRCVVVSRTSGFAWRIIRVMSRRSARSYRTAPSGCSRNQTSFTPTTAAAAICSARRICAAASGAMSSMPASPLVAMT